MFFTTLIMTMTLQVQGLPGPSTFGSVFSLVSGMMACVALLELLPNARNFDPTDKVTSKSLVLGLALMAATLVLMAYVGAA